MNPIRVACVRYLNTWPLIEGLDKLAGIELIPSAPAAVVDLVRSGRADVGLASIVDAAGGAAGGAGGGLSVLAAARGMIGCDGPTLTVRLYSRVPWSRVTRVHADSESHTSVVLCRLVLARAHGVRPEVVQHRAEPGAEWPETLMAIGDKVVNAAPPAGMYAHELDLGEAWKALTGRGFVYAAWMCRTDRAHEPVMASAAALLDRQRRRNAARLDWIIQHRAPAHTWPPELAQRYLAHLLRYELGEPERAAADEFVRLAHAEGFLPSGVLSWAGLAASPAAGV